MKLKYDKFNIHSYEDGKRTLTLSGAGRYGLTADELVDGTIALLGDIDSQYKLSQIETIAQRFRSIADRVRPEIVEREKLALLRKSAWAQFWRYREAEAERIANTELSAVRNSALLGETEKAKQIKSLLALASKQIDDSLLLERFKTDNPDIADLLVQ